MNNKEASKQVSQIQKEIDSLQKKINSRKVKLDITNDTLGKMKSETEQQVKKEMPKANAKQINEETNSRLSENKSYKSLIKEKDKLNDEIVKFDSLLETANSKVSTVEPKTVKRKTAMTEQEPVKEQTSQDTQGGLLNGMQGKMGQVGKIVQAMQGAFSKIPNITKIITGNIKKMGAGLKSGLGHILKYAANLFNLKGIYNVLKGSAQSWLSSQNSGAQQLSANIEYMRYAMGGVFAPVISYVVNLVYQLMKAIQSVVYAFSGVNIFAKATAASMGKTASGAKQTSKSLNGIHGEINNVSENSDSSGGSGGGAITPSIDLSQMDNQMSSFAQKLYDFSKPLVDSWNTYGGGLVEQVKVTVGQIGGLISSVWGSFENIITNGTVYSILENILDIIGNIAEAFSNAWNYNGNGDAIVQNLANAFDNLLTAINNVVKSEGFQNFLKFCSDKFREMSEKIAEINWQPLMDTLSNIGQNVGKMVLEVLNGLVDIFKWLVENPIVVDILIGIATAIGIVAGAIGLITEAIKAYNMFMDIATLVSDIFGMSISWLILIIIAIIAVIAAIVLAIMNWDKIMKALSDTWEWIKQKAIEIFTVLGEFFARVWQGICDVVVNVWNGICSFFKGIWDWIVQTVTNVFNNIKQFISDTLNGIATIWNNIWGGISSFVSNIWNGIVNTISNVWNVIITKVKEGVSGAWNAITSVFGGIASWFGNIFKGAWEAVKNVFSKGGAIFDGIKDGILNGLKVVINAIIGGINKVIAIPFNGINAALRKIRSVDIMGFQPFSWISTIGVPQIPQLAKGAVLDSPTIAMMGEYLGAKTNPEIVTPQNIMAETFRNEMTDILAANGNSNKPIRVQVYWGTKNVVDEIIEGINEKARQTGKAQIKVAYDY